MKQFFHWIDFFEASFDILGHIKEPHITRRSEFNWKPVGFKRFAFSTDVWGSAEGVG